MDVLFPSKPSFVTVLFLVEIAAVDAKLGWTFVGLGLHPGMGATHFTPRLLGQITFIYSVNVRGGV